MTVLNFAGYCITKYGVEGFSDALRREMRPWGVLVSIVAPGPFQTPIFKTELIIEKYCKVWDKLPSDVAQEYGERFFHDSKCKIIMNLNKMNYQKILYELGGGVRLQGVTIIIRAFHLYDPGLNSGLCKCNCTGTKK